MGTKRWRGGAADTAQVATLTFSAYTSGQTYTITCNSKDVSFTATASTADNVFDGLVAALEATDEVEFADFSAENNGGTNLVITGAVAGKPFTITASATGGITPTLTLESTAATGPNHWNEATNWEGGVLPVGGDDIIIENSSDSILYGIEDTNNYTSLTIHSTYTGEIGLPANNESGYREYRPRFLKLGDGTSALSITSGEGSGRQSSRIYIDLNDGTANLKIYGTGSSLDEEYPFIIKNTDASSVIDMLSGRLKVDADTSGSMSNLRCTPPEGSNQLQVLCTDVVACGVVVVGGGDVEIHGSAVSLEAWNGARVRIVDDATCPIVTVGDSAVVYWSTTAGITTNLMVYPNGIIDFSESATEKTVTDCTVYSNGVVRDPLSVITWADGLELSGAKLGEVQIDLGRSRKITPNDPNSGQEIFDTENADVNLTTAGGVTVLTDTPDPTGLRNCQAVIFMGDGVKDLDGSGGVFEVTITIGGATWGGGPEEFTLGTETQAAVVTNEFVVPAGSEVIIKVKSPNPADSDVDVTAYLVSAD